MQRSAFNAPPSGVSSSATAALPSKPTSAVDQVMRDDTPESRGQKRVRGEEDEDGESESDVAMEEDSDDE